MRSSMRMIVDLILYWQARLHSIKSWKNNNFTRLFCQPWLVIGINVPIFLKIMGN